MKEEIRLLKTKSMLDDARGPQAAAVPRYGEDKLGNADRDRNIVGKWAWIPARAVKKPISEIIIKYNNSNGIKNDIQKQIKYPDACKDSLGLRAYISDLKLLRRVAQEQLQVRSHAAGARGQPVLVWRSSTVSGARANSKQPVLCGESSLKPALSPPVART